MTHLSSSNVSVSKEARCQADRRFHEPSPQPSRPIDAKYVTKGTTHRGELEWSMLSQLIKGRSGFTDVIKVKSHLEDVGPTASKQNKIDFHHMLANSSADVVAEEAAKRLLPDMNLESTT